MLLKVDIVKEAEGLEKLNPWVHLQTSETFQPLPRPGMCGDDDLDIILFYKAVQQGQDLFQVYWVINVLFPMDAHKKVAPILKLEFSQDA